MSKFDNRLKGRFSDTQLPYYVDIRADASTHTLQTIDYEHHEIHSGSHFTAMWSVADIGAATTPNDMMTLTFTTPNTTKWAHMVCLFSCVGGTLCTIREGGTGGATPTGDITCFNNNRNSTTTSGLKNIAGTAGLISYDATADTGGSLLVNQYIAGAATVQARAGSAAESGGRYEWVLKQNTRYQIAMMSTATAAGVIVLHWYEHTDKN